MRWVAGAVQQEGGGLGPILSARSLSCVREHFTAIFWCALEGPPGIAGGRDIGVAKEGGPSRVAGDGKHKKSTSCTGAVGTECSGDDSCRTHCSAERTTNWAAAEFLDGSLHRAIFSSHVSVR